MSGTRQLSIPTLLRAQTLFAEGATAEQVYEALSGEPAASGTGTADTAPADTARLEKRLDALAARVAEDTAAALRRLEERLDKLAATIERPPQDAPQDGLERLENLDASMTTLLAELRGLREEMSDSQGDAGAVAKTLSEHLPDTASLEEAMAAMCQDLGQLKTQREEIPAAEQRQLREAVEALRERVPDQAALDAAVEALRQELADLRQALPQDSGAAEERRKLREALETLAARVPDKAALDATLGGLASDIGLVKAESERRITELAGLESRLTRESALAALLERLETLIAALAAQPGPEETAAMPQALAALKDDVAALRADMTQTFEAVARLGEGGADAQLLRDLRDTIQGLAEHRRGDEEGSPDEALAALHRQGDALAEAVAGLEQRLARVVEHLDAAVAEAEQAEAEAKTQAPAEPRPAGPPVRRSALLQRALARRWAAATPSRRPPPSPAPAKAAPPAESEDVPAPSASQPAEPPEPPPAAPVPPDEATEAAGDDGAKKPRRRRRGDGGFAERVDDAVLTDIRRRIGDAEAEDGREGS